MCYNLALEKIREFCSEKVIADSRRYYKDELTLSRKEDQILWVPKNTGKALRYRGVQCVQEPRGSRGSGMCSQ